ncbi:MAG: hypothetical protein ACI4BD_01245 [Paludibacteraceae bacterium]
MKKLFFFAALLAASLCATAQQNQVVWENGKVMFASPVATIDSLTFSGTAEEMDTLHMLLPRTVVRVNTVYIHDTIYECPNAPLPGVFSVSADKQVRFSKGNLQYTITTGTWAFAEKQYERLFIADSENCKTFGKTDLPGWSTTGAAKWGISNSLEEADYKGDFVDWGQSIGDGTTWRTLTKEEWEYLLDGRTNAANLKGVARIQINDTVYVNGLILLPDDSIDTDIAFNCGFEPNSGSRIKAYATHQTFTTEQWDRLEEAGAVFLPTTGWRSWHNGERIIDYADECGHYWAAPPTTVSSIWAATFYPYTNYMATEELPLGLAVRLVQDL